MNDANDAAFVSSRRAVAYWLTITIGTRTTLLGGPVGVLSRGTGRRSILIVVG